jgi:hypothetical protein
MTTVTTEALRHVSGEARQRFRATPSIVPLRSKRLENPFDDGLRREADLAEPQRAAIVLLHSKHLEKAALGGGGLAAHQTTTLLRAAYMAARLRPRRGVFSPP